MAVREKEGGKIGAGHAHPRLQSQEAKSRPLSGHETSFQPVLHECLPHYEHVVVFVAVAAAAATLPLPGSAAPPPPPFYIPLFQASPGEMPTRASRRQECTGTRYPSLSLAYARPRPAFLPRAAAALQSLRPAPSRKTVRGERGTRG